MFKNTIFYLLIFFSLISCVSKKEIIYMNDIPSAKSMDNILSYEPTLQPDDMLGIIVSAENPELTVPFNMPQIQTSYALSGNQSSLKSYLIDSEGSIDYPVVGKIKLAGMNKTEANLVIVKKISDYFKTTPSVNLSIINFKVSVIGEVKNPSTFPISSNRITVLEALTMAGDLTIFGNRKNVLIIRESNGKKTFNRIDLTNSNFIESPYYYLSQNDVIYVEPNKTVVNNSAIGANTTILFSITSVLISLLVFFVKK
jgi:polysaccharide biosynthesis/export protein